MRVEIVEIGKGDAFYPGYSLVGRTGTFATESIGSDGFYRGYFYQDNRPFKLCLARVKTKPVFDDSGR